MLLYSHAAVFMVYIRVEWKLLIRWKACSGLLHSTAL